MLNGPNNKDKLRNEEIRAEQEKRRSGMPGAIREWAGLRGVFNWSKQRSDVKDYYLAKVRNPELG